MTSLFEVPIRIGLVVTAVVATVVVSAYSAIAAPVDTGVGSTYECTGDVAGFALDPVVLVHGTWTTSEESFGPVLEPWLTRTGRAFCTVELPARATGDMQISARYVTDAILRTAATRGGKVDVVGHSQGGTLGIYAIDTDPAVAAVVDDYVGLAPALRGQTQTEQLCATIGGCSAAIWQFAAGSDFMTAVETTPLAAGPSFTTVATVFDEIVRPAPYANSKDGASNVVIQDVCPGRYVGHALLPSDAAAIAVLADALDNPGPADRARIGSESCGALYPPGTDPLAQVRGAPAAGLGLLQAQFASPRIQSEPPYTGP